MTNTQLSYRKPATPFMKTFGAINDRSNCKPKDDMTIFRERVYEVWNVTGTHQPCCFRP